MAHRAVPRPAQPYPPGARRVRQAGARRRPAPQHGKEGATRASERGWAARQVSDADIDVCTHGLMALGNALRSEEAASAVRRPLNGVGG